MPPTIAIGMGAQVTVVDRSADALRRLSAQFGNAISTVYSTRSAIAELVKEADLVIGAVLIPGAAAPKLVSREMIASMKKGAVVVDIAIDQGGCFETSHATTHSDPTYLVDGVVHYCVANMPGAVARTSTFALNNATLPFALALADQGWREALLQDRHLLAGLNVCEGAITCEPVAEAQGLPFADPLVAIAEEPERSSAHRSICGQGRVLGKAAVARSAGSMATFRTVPPKSRARTGASRHGSRPGFRADEAERFSDGSGPRPASNVRGGSERWTRATSDSKIRDDRRRIDGSEEDLVFAARIGAHREGEDPAVLRHLDPPGRRSDPFHHASALLRFWSVWNTMRANTRRGQHATLVQNDKAYASRESVA